MTQRLERPWQKPPLRFCINLAISCLFLQLLFLGNLSHLYGTLFQDSSRIHNLNVLYVDYDGGEIGRSVIEAYGILAADNFPTINHISPGKFPTPADVRSAVCNGDYWGAVYVFPNASDSLKTAIARGEDTPTTLAYIWNGARYTAFAESAVYSNILMLIQKARSTYQFINAPTMRALLSNTSSVQVFLDPIQAAEINIKRTQQGTRVFYNTVSMIMPVIMQFFFVLSLNGISSEFNLFKKFNWHTNGFIRLCVSVIYTLISSLSMTGYIWGFKESWRVNGSQFILTLITYWLYMHINFLFFDILTAFIPTQFMPFCVLTWMLLSISSTISPFELSPGFYRWSYALPAHETYLILNQIWSDGCNNQLHIALPILLSWWIVGIALAVYAVYYRCKGAHAPGNDMAPSEEYQLKERRAIHL